MPLISKDEKITPEDKYFAVGDVDFIEIPVNYASCLAKGHLPAENPSWAIRRCACGVRYWRKIVTAVAHT